MTQETTQQAVYAAVRDRGYVDPWTWKQFIARNVAKLLEEVGELCHYITVGLVEHGANDAYVKGMVAGICAKRAFDEPMAWENHIKLDILKLEVEAADAQVVLFCLQAQKFTKCAKIHFLLI